MTINILLAYKWFQLKPFSKPFLIFIVLIMLPIKILNADMIIIAVGIILSETFVYVSIIDKISNNIKLIIIENILPFNILMILSFFWIRVFNFFHTTSPF